MGAPSQPAADLLRVIGWLAVLWACFGIQCWAWAARGVNLAAELGVRPGEARGLSGLVLGPLLHQSPTHLLLNSLALAPLGWLTLRQGRGRCALALLVGALLGGLAAWLLGEPGAGAHVGASGLAFALLGLLLGGALSRVLPRAAAGAIVAALLAGAALGLGLLGAPGSWPSHAGGALAGGLLAAAWPPRRLSA